MASCFLGFLAEEAKRRHVNALIISRLIGNGLPEIGLRATLDGLLHFIGDFFEADQVKLVLRRVAGDDAFLWEAKRPRGRRSNRALLKALRRRAQSLFCRSPLLPATALSHSFRRVAIALLHRADTLPRPSLTPPPLVRMEPINQAPESRRVPHVCLVTGARR